MPQSNSLAAGTIGGTFLSVLPNLTSADLLKTIVQATTKQPTKESNVNVFQV